MRHVVARLAEQCHRARHVLQPGDDATALEPFRNGLEGLGLLLLDVAQHVGDEAVVQGAELERAEHAPDLVGVPRPDAQVLELGLDVHVVAQRHDAEVGADLALVLDQ